MMFKVNERGLEEREVNPIIRTTGPLSPEGISSCKCAFAYIVYGRGGLQLRRPKGINSSPFGNPTISYYLVETLNIINMFLLNYIRLK